MNETSTTWVVFSMNGWLLNFFLARYAKQINISSCYYSKCSKIHLCMDQKFTTCKSDAFIQTGLPPPLTHNELSKKTTTNILFSYAFKMHNGKTAMLLLHIIQDWIYLWNVNNLIRQQTPQQPVVVNARVCWLLVEEQEQILCSLCCYDPHVSSSAR